ncbi:Acetylglutamate kinase [hydrothermal vent metagenome]|uniref:acetylglutamate kinase n=1 Tax=hydrothermal vent metagenome TaxID=652676 RepID=A0A1W1EKP9_9ZZZZ
MKNKIDTIKTLFDALPFIKKFNNEKIVIKYGGSAQTSEKLKIGFVQDIALLHLVGIKPIIVHGGGKSITNLLAQLNIESKFIDGQRVTTKEVLRVAEMVLSGEINKEIVSLLNREGTKSMGLSGKDGNLLEAIPKDFKNFGYTGVIEKVNPEIVDTIIDNGFIPVIAPIAGCASNTYSGFNINADIAASEIAIATNARKILFLTDTQGVLDKDKNLISNLSLDDCDRLIEDGTIHGGMLPKVDACITALKGGVKKAHIIDGEQEHSLLLEILTSAGVGSCIEL